MSDALGREDVRAWGLTEPYRFSRKLASLFPCLESVEVRRSWLDRSVEFRASLRKPVAAVSPRGREKEAAWLSESGVVFRAPEGAYPEEAALPVVDLSRVPAPELPRLARFLEAVSREGALPSPLARFDMRSPEEGWEGVLQDGTRLLWGDLSWTEDKLKRLKEVAADAGRRFDSAYAVDLRYFGDGKILVSPL